MRRSFAVRRPSASPQSASGFNGTMTNEPAHTLLEESYIAASPLLLVPGRLGRFNIHVQHENKFVVYAKADENYTDAQRRQLHTAGVEEIFIPKCQEPLFKEYLADNLGDVLQDDSATIEERARVLHDTSLSIVQEAYERKLPDSLAMQNSFRRIQEFIQQAVDFLANEKSLGTVAKLISHDYRTFSHSVHVFLYSAAILQTYGLDKRTLVDAGIGAMLHDIGKSLISKDILTKRGALTLDERDEINKHPGLGATLCAGLPLTPATTSSILYHHEKLDGSGYPCGLSGDEIPLHVRAVVIADIYDAMTSTRPYCKAMNPFQALRIMRDEMFSEIDIPMFQRFIKVLSGAEIV